MASTKILIYMTIEILALTGFNEFITYKYLVGERKNKIFAGSLFLIIGVILLAITWLKKETSVISLFLPICLAIVLVGRLLLESINVKIFIPTKVQVCYVLILMLGVLIDRYIIFYPQNVNFISFGDIAFLLIMLAGIYYSKKKTKIKE